ncbi:Ras family protein [Loa loa]|nr:Ras family protein [Loa loa]EFO26094.2 Ras family protein [Loa loa]
MRIGASELCREEHEYMLKFLLVGDSDVGKDEIADLLGPSVSYTPDALFIPFAVPKTTTILLEGKFVRLQLWNASGQGRFSTIIKSYSRGVQGILLVYDITNRWSFDGIRRWLAEIDEHAPGVPRILIGNRLHLEFNRAVPRHEAEYFARKRNMQYFEISTLAYFNVHESITELARLVISRNGMQWLWKSSQVASLQDLCCRAVVKYISNVHAIDRLPLPTFLQLKVRSFASGADLCMHSVIRRQYATPYFSSASKYITRFVRARNTNTKDRLRNANCDLM